MSRFQFNEDDFDYDDDDLSFEDEQEELLDQIYMLYPQNQNTNQYLQIAQAGLAAMELNHKMVRLAIEVAAKSWFWRWRRLDKKLDMIAKTYRKLSTLLEVRKEDAVL